MNNGKKLLVMCSLGILLGTSSKVYALPLTQRIAGNDRYETAIQVSRTGWTDKSKYIVLATGEDFPDALCAAPLAKKLNSPVLLNSKGNLLSSVKEEIKRLGAEQVIIVGGLGVISSSVEDELKTMDIKYTRIYGEDRYETSVKIAEQLNNNEDIAVVTGLDFPDAISISSIAAQTGMPILLTDKDYIPKSVAGYLQNRNIKNTYIIGGKDVVSDGVANNLPSVKRLEGNDRYDTNIAVINNFRNELNFSSIYVATGEDYPDALAASLLAAKTKSPICLVSDSSVDRLKNIIAQKLEESTKILPVGGTDVVSNSVVQELSQKNGNTNGNLNSGYYDKQCGFVTRQGDWNYYYMEGIQFSSALGSLYKIKNDSTESILLDTDTDIRDSKMVNSNIEIRSNINVVGEYIYYQSSVNLIKGEDDLTYLGGIYKLKTDGTGKTRIGSDNVSEIVVVGDSIYYRNLSDNANLYKIGVDGTGREKVMDNNCGQINFLGDSIYYLKYIDCKLPTKIYKAKVGGTDEKEIQCSEQIKRMIVDGDYIYYLGFSDGSDTNSIFKMKIDGSKKSKICDLPHYINTFNVLDGNIYYVKYETDKNGQTSSYLCSILNNGETNTIYIGKGVETKGVCIIDNMIYFYANNNDGYINLCRMNAASSNIQIVKRIKF